MYQLVPRVPGFLGCPVSPVRRNKESNHRSHVGNSVEEIKGRNEKEKQREVNTLFILFDLKLMHFLGMFVSEIAFEK